MTGKRKFKPEPSSYIVCLVIMAAPFGHHCYACRGVQRPNAGVDPRGLTCEVDMQLWLIQHIGIYSREDHA